MNRAERIKLCLATLREIETAVVADTAQTVDASKRPVFFEATVCHRVEHVIQLYCAEVIDDGIRSLQAPL